MRILITGAAGFIGSALTLRLGDSSYQIVCLDNFDETLNSSYERRNIFKSLASNPNLELIVGDLNNLDLERIVSGTDVIIHCAATPGLVPSWTHFDQYLKNNVKATHTLAKMAADFNIPRFILLSTSSVYGKVATCDENGPIDPSSPYGITKFSAEMIAKNLLINTGVELTILRLFSIYGPGQREDMGIRRFINSYLHLDSVEITGDGSHKRTFTYIDDLIDLIEKLLVFQLTPGTYNISGKEQVKILDLLDILESLTRRKIERKFLFARRGDQLDTFGNTLKAQHILGWNPKTEFRVGLEKQLMWQKSLRS